MLTIIQVGNNEASNRYVRNKRRAIEENGLKSDLVKLNEDISTDEVIEFVNVCASMPECKALMVQLPLPYYIDEYAVLNAIPPHLDIDGLGEFSKEIPLTPSAIMRWLHEYFGEGGLKGKNVAIFGRSGLVGLPLANCLIEEGATVTVFNSKSDDVVKSAVCWIADIIITATGNVNTLKPEYIQHRTIVIDVGINRDENGKLCGDVSKAVRDKIDEFGGYCTPVPGGVGKWTVAELIHRLKEFEEK